LEPNKEVSKEVSLEHSEEEEPRQRKTLDRGLKRALDEVEDEGEERRGLCGLFGKSVRVTQRKMLQVCLNGFVPLRVTLEWVYAQRRISMTVIRSLFWDAVAAPWVL
jgi:hypothetical protein